MVGRGSNLKDERPNHRQDIRVNPILLDVAPRGTPETCMTSILVLSFRLVCSWYYWTDPLAENVLHFR